jgi:hypothetical protein
MAYSINKDKFFKERAGSIQVMSYLLNDAAKKQQHGILRDFSFDTNISEESKYVCIS